MRTVEAPPSIAMIYTGKPHIRQHLKEAGDVLDRHAQKMKEAGARREDHYAMNQLAHWLWRLSGAERG